MANWIYVPGLSRPNTPGATPMKRLEAFEDVYLTGAVARITQLYKATLIDCGKKLRWVSIDGTKAEKILGSVHENMLAKVAGMTATAPKPTMPDEAAGIDFSSIKVKKTFLAIRSDAKDTGAPALAGVGADDTLFIVGHGSARGGGMTAKWNWMDEHYVVDPTALATHLGDEGLPLTHKVIHAVMCFGGGIADETLQTVQPFAQRLAKDLFDRGWKKIKVLSATGVVVGPNLTVRPGLKEDKAKNRFIVTVKEEEYEKSLKTF